MIRIQQLTKKFGDEIVLKDCNLEIEENSISAITGKNGAGKTTLLKLISGLLLPDDGQIFIDKYEITQNRVIAKKYVSIALNTDGGFYPYLTLKENLVFYSKIYRRNLDDFNEFIKILQLKDFLDKKFFVCSSGIKVKFWLLVCIMKDSKVMLIDELTKSVDVETQNEIYQLIKILKYKYKKTIIFVSHNLQEVVELSDSWFRIENCQIIKEK